MLHHPRLPYIQQKNVDVSQAMDSHLKCTDLLCAVKKPVLVT